MFSFQEDLLHYVWKLKYFHFSKLRTTEGESVDIIHPGYHNFDSGPDFSESKIRINHTLWIGNVEIHIKSSDWVKHTHYRDRAYDNVILHVVYEEDEKILRPNGTIIPCLELKGLIQEEIFTRYHYLKTNENWIPCQNMIAKTDELRKKIWLEKLLIERLEHKSSYLKELLAYTNHDWEYCFFILLGKYFGSSVNTAAFDQLCRSVSLDKIFKNQNNSFAIEALLFGQSGFLSEKYQDDYPAKLCKEYKFLKHKYALKPIPKKLWKFFRLRPSNFPTIRIAQFAALISNNKSLCSKSLEFDNLVDFGYMFQMKINEYWDTHFVFDKESAYIEKPLGQSFQNTLLINAIIPFIFMYGKSKNEPMLVERAVRFLQSLPPEANKLTNQWKKLGLKGESAAETQSLIQLKKNYCDKNRCLQCSIGHQIMQEPIQEYEKIISEVE